MDFIVNFSNGAVGTYSGEDARFELRDNGVLIITFEGKQLNFSPVAWLSIERDEPGSAYTRTV